MYLGSHPKFSYLNQIFKATAGFSRIQMLVHQPMIQFFWKRKWERGHLLATNENWRYLNQRAAVLEILLQTRLNSKYNSRTSFSCLDSLGCNTRGRWPPTECNGTYFYVDMHMIALQKKLSMNWIVLKLVIIDLPHHFQWCLVMASFWS